MRKPLFFSLILLVLLLPWGQTIRGEEEFPKATGLINDFAGVIPAGDKQRMDLLATEILQKTGAEIAVVTMPTIGDSDAATYANRLFEKWGIGKKGKDNGVLIFLTRDERRIRIEVGYGLEGILPDGLVGEILDKYAVPFLKEDEYGKGLYNALAAVSAVIAKDANVELTGEVTVYRVPRRRGTGFSPLFFLLFFILLPLVFRRRGGILPLLLLSSMGGRGGYGGGFGGFGGGFGGFGGGMSGGGGAGRGF